MNTLQFNIDDFRARSVDFCGSQLEVVFVDGRRISTPLDWYPRLLRASADQRANYEITPMGIHWPELDEDLSVAAMLRGQRERSDAVKELLRLAKSMPFNSKAQEQQRLSFVYGNTALDNNNITRTLVEMEAGKLARN